MLTVNSILRRLPAEIERPQVIFLDGIRHAAEIAELSYRRLQKNLTEIALDDSATPNPELTSAAFLDAWALVDVMDRFGALWKGLPHTDARSEFAEFKAVRTLRNITDHLAKRVEYVVSRNGSAMGSLSWFTLRDREGAAGLICALVPGTTSSGSHPASNSGGQEIEVPTDLIHLTAAGHTADLSKAFHEMASLISELEIAVQDGIDKLGLTGSQAGADLLLRIAVKGVQRVP